MVNLYMCILTTPQREKRKKEKKEKEKEKIAEERERERERDDVQSYRVFCMYIYNTA